MRIRLFAIAVSLLVFGWFIDRAGSAIPLRQSTSVTFRLGPFLDATDHVTEEPGLTVDSTEVKLSKAGAALAAKTDTTDLVHDANGLYACVLNAADADTLGPLLVYCNANGAGPVRQDFEVLPANVYDSLYSSDKLQVHLVEANDNVIVDANNLDIADAVWDDVITSTYHSTTNSGAYYLRRLYQTLVSSVNLAAGGDVNSITLANTESIVPDFFKGQTIAVFAGTGAGQARACYAYDGTTNIALIRPLWATKPDKTSWYAILNVGSSVVAAIENDPLVAIREEIDANSTQLAAIVADTNELQTDWADGGRLDLLLDGVKAMTDLMAIVTTTLADVNATDANEFTLTAGQDANDAYWMHAVMVEDATDGHSEIRWIELYEAGRIVTVDEPFSFTPAIGDKAWILGPVYGGLLYQVRSLVQTARNPIYYYDTTGKGPTIGTGPVTYIKD